MVFLLRYYSFVKANVFITMALSQASLDGKTDFKRFAASGSIGYSVVTYNGSLRMAAADSQVASQSSSRIFVCLQPHLCKWV